ncbi:Uncharacterised protein [Enterobacter cloacae]|nr:Uncharacterised protein [Enterobacter cloacae]
MAQELEALRQRGLFRRAVDVRFTAERISRLNHQRQRVGPDGHLRRQPGVIKIRQQTVEIHQQHAGVARMQQAQHVAQALLEGIHTGGNRRRDNRLTRGDSEIADRRVVYRHGKIGGGNGLFCRQGLENTEIALQLPMTATVDDGIDAVFAQHHQAKIDGQPAA